MCIRDGNAIYVDLGFTTDTSLEKKVKMVFSFAPGLKVDGTDVQRDV